MQEDEKERRVIVPDREHLWRAVHPEQANKCVGFVGGVELQYHRAERSVPLPLVLVRKNVRRSRHGEDDATKRCARHRLGLHSEMHGSWRDRERDNS